MLKLLATVLLAVLAPAGVSAAAALPMTFECTPTTTTGVAGLVGSAASVACFGKSIEPGADVCTGPDCGAVAFVAESAEAGLAAVGGAPALAALRAMPVLA